MRSFVLIPFVLLAGCANPFTQFYFDQTGGVDIATLDAVELSSEPPKAFTGNDSGADTQALLQNGYTMVGYSHFNAAEASEAQMLAQAKAVHAEIVVFYSEYTNTVSGAVPLTLPTTQTSTTNMNGSIYGSGGYANYSGTATTTTTGSKTTYIPYSRNRFDYLATYWVKLKPMSLGVYVENLTPETRQRIGSNKGVFIKTIINDSPAFMADLIAGDILKTINGVEVINENDFVQKVRAAAGTEADFEVWRDGETITKSIQLRP